MESPVRKMLKRNDYNRHKLLRKIKRRNKARAEQESKAAEKELKRRLRWTAPKFEDGKDQYNFYPSAFDSNGNLKPELTVTTPAVFVTPLISKRNDLIEQHELYNKLHPNNPIYPDILATNYNQNNTIRQDNRSWFWKNILQPVWNYGSKFGYDVAKGNVVGGEYTMPAIAVAGLIGGTGAAASVGNSVSTAMANPYVQGAFALDAAYRQGFTDEGWRKTLKALLDKRYGDAALSGAGDVLDLTMMAPTLYKGWNWANRNYVLPYNLYSEIGKTSPVLEELNPTIRTRLGDVEIDNPNLFYRQDNPYSGAFDHANSYVQNGMLIPGLARIEGQNNYSWWNKGKPFLRVSVDHPVGGINDKPTPRLFTAADSDGLFLRVKDQNYPIGQWNGKRGLVLLSEYVSPEAVNISNSTYMYEPNYGYRKVSTEPEVSTIDFNTARTAQNIDPELYTSIGDRTFELDKNNPPFVSELEEIQNLLKTKSTSKIYQWLNENPALAHKIITAKASAHPVLGNNKELQQTLDDVLEFYKKDVYPRLIAADKERGIMSPLRPNLLSSTPGLDNVEVTTLNIPHTRYNGFAIGNEQYIFPNSNYDIGTVIAHETRHNLGNYLREKEIKNVLYPRYNGYTIDEHRVLNDAYKFSDEYLQHNPQIDPLREKAATNTEFRYSLHKDTGFTGKKLDDYIDSIDAYDLSDWFMETNGYADDIVKQVDRELYDGSYREHIEKWADKVKKALKYVGAYLLPATITGKYAHKLQQPHKKK